MRLDERPLRRCAARFLRRRVALPARLSRTLHSFSRCNDASTENDGGEGAEDDGRILLRKCSESADRVLNIDVGDALLHRVNEAIVRAELAQERIHSLSSRFVELNFTIRNVFHNASYDRGWLCEVSAR